MTYLSSTLPTPRCCELTLLMHDRNYALKEEVAQLVCGAI